jgi:hypothetical protein
MGRRRDDIRERLAGAELARPMGQSFLAPGCPVTPLGSVDGNLFCYLNDVGQFRIIEASKHSKNVITSLFATTVDWLRANYPRTIDKETGQPRSWMNEPVAEALMGACQAVCPSLDLTDALRGRGVWPGADDALVVHLGGTMIAGKGQMQAGRTLGRHIYPRRPEMLTPVADPQPAGVQDGPAAELAAWLGRWRFEHGFGARLLAGWIGAALLCGALPWRPHVWLIAPRGAGKSTLIAFLARLLAGMLLSVEDATEAALRGTLECDALPIALDEQEPSEDSNQRLYKIINLLRLASSGGTVIRGTADHGTVRQVLRFAAIAASVVRPPLTTQDLTRITPLALRPLARDAVPPALPESVLRLLGRRLFRRMLDAWPRWEETRAQFHRGLRESGLDARNADQFGTLLACAWLLEHDLPPDTDTLAEWCAGAMEVARPHLEEDRPEWFRCIEFLAGLTVPDEYGKRNVSVAELVATACRRAESRSSEDGQVTETEAAHAQAALSRVGLRVELATDERGLPVWLEGGGQDGWLAVANAHPQLARLFERSRWAGRAGTAGAWKGVLEQAPESRLSGAVRFGARTSRCVRVPLRHVFGAEREIEP